MTTFLRSPHALAALLVWTTSAGAQAPAAPAPAASVLGEAAREALDAWFATPPAERGALPPACADVEGFSADAARSLRRELWASYRRGAERLGWRDDLIEATDLGEVRRQMRTAEGRKQGFQPQAGELSIGDGKKMPYVLFAKGARPEAGWPLFFALHGGGRSSEKQTDPHGWDVNDSEWRAQMQLCLMRYPDGLYFIPRMADDNDGRWKFGYNHEAFERVIRLALLFRDVDPDRVYMLGISQGGYGTDALSTYMTDRLAAADAMAAGSGGAFVENLRNLPFRTDIGAEDTTYDRLALARECHARLDALRVEDPGGYDHVLAVQEGRGHGIDYRPGPSWLPQHVRRSRPETVVWTARALQRGTHPRDSYWLQLPDELDGRRWIRARIDRDANLVTIDARQAIGKDEVRAAEQDPAQRAPMRGRLVVQLDDELLDLDRDVTIVANGERVVQRRCTRRLADMVRGLVERGDPTFSFPVRVELTLAAATAPEADRAHQAPGQPIR